MGHDECMVKRPCGGPWVNVQKGSNKCSWAVEKATALLTLEVLLPGTCPIMDKPTETINVAARIPRYPRRYIHATSSISVDLS